MVYIVFTSWILFSTIFSVCCILVEKLQQHEEPGMNEPRKNKRNKKVGNFYRKLNKKRCHGARHAGFKFMQVWFQKDENGTEEDFYLGDRKMNFITDDFNNRYPGDDNLVEVTKRDAMISSLGEHRAIIEAALDRYGRTYPMKKIPRIARYQIQYSA